MDLSDRTPIKFSMTFPLNYNTTLESDTRYVGAACLINIFGEVTNNAPPLCRRGFCVNPDKSLTDVK
ncbi:MAG: hypothetical protein PHO29_03995 [Acetobacterium sp.]|nr:hypothetical protein [Acetobacterium sp.]